MMGDTADLMLEGILCETCGEFIQEKGPGYPVQCGACDDADLDECPICGRQDEHTHDFDEGGTG